MKLCETHTYVDGVCTVCGYACAHENMTDHGKWANAVYTKLDEEMHHAVYDYVIEHHCSDCGYTYDQLIEAGREDDEPHEWLIMNPNATDCRFCGAVKPCETHDWEFAEGDSDDMVCSVCGKVCSHEWGALDRQFENNKREFTKIDDTTHSYVYDLYNRYSCTVCIAKHTELAAEGLTATANHDFVDDESLTECSACGAVKLCEMHTYVDSVCTVCGYACEHENSTMGDHGTWENAEYTIIDTVYHHAVYDYAECYTCNDCGKQYTVIVDEGRADLEEHVYPSDDVKACVFCHACKTHTFENGVCSTCGVKEPCEIHIFFDGECTICGRVETCDHEHVEEGRRFKRDEAFASMDEMTHVHTFSVWTKYTCLDCGDSYGIWFENGYEVDDHAFRYDPSLTVCNQCGMNKPCTEHTFDGMGICTTCGYCLHQWSSGSEFIGMEMLDPVNQNDDQFHIQPYLSLSKRTCNNCEKTFVKASKMEGEEGHTFDENGLCACGATGTPTTCEHENVEFGPMDVVVYSDKTLTQHTVKTDVYWTGWCPDCETYRMRQLDMPGTAETVNHTYVDGTCSACGHYYLTGIENVYALPEGLKEIEAEAFVENNVEAVIVPDSCVKIGAVAFADCAQLKVVVLPSNTENISRDAFIGCPDVVLFVAEGSAAKAFCNAVGYNYLVVE